MNTTLEEFETRHQRIAWGIHVFTSLGIMAGFFAVVAVLDHSPRAALYWLMAAMIIDGLDGPIARHYDVARIVPAVDGNALDLMIDYVCCVVAPALFIHEFDLLPHEYNVSLIGVFLILTSSLYVMSNKNIQTPDKYFRGFPSMWNLVANVMFVLQSTQWANVVTTAILVVVSFVPVMFIHPIRVRDFRQITLPVLVVWLTAIIYLTWRIGDGDIPVSGTDEMVQLVVYAGLVWILGVGIWRTVHGPMQRTVTAPA